MSEQVIEVIASRAIGQLSDKQRQCLRLVGRGMSSKEIAIETGLTPLTVDTYLKAAISKLGVSNRREAARMFAEMEASRGLGSPSPMVAASLPEPQSRDATAAGGWRHHVALPPLGGRWNELDWVARTFAILRIATVSAVVVIAIALLVAAAMATFS